MNTPMPDGSPQQRRLERLRQWRNKAQPDRTLSFVREQVEKNIVKPHKQIGNLAALWREAVPEKLAVRTALRGIARGVLTVQVADSPTHYELDRLLRSGLEQQLRQACKVPLRKIKISVGPL